MKVTILCSDPRHPAWNHLRKYALERGYTLVAHSDQLEAGDYLFMVSCTEILPLRERSLFRHCLVIHESDLPHGKGWSPLAWQIVEGERFIPFTLLEAAQDFDSGDVWQKRQLVLEGHELADEIAEAAVGLKCEMMDWAIKHPVRGTPQSGKSSYYRRRTVADSRLDPHLPLASQFDLLRICEPRFPAFFDLRGHRYEVTVRKA